MDRCPRLTSCRKFSRSGNSADKCLNFTGEEICKAGVKVNNKRR